jgi:hypothetical protein
MSNGEQLRRQAEHCQHLAAGVATFPGLAASLLATARNNLERATKLDKVAPMQQQIQPRNE